jgi:hypothetical protein
MEPPFKRRMHAMATVEPHISSGYLPKEFMKNTSLGRKSKEYEDIKS